MKQINRINDAVKEARQRFIEESRKELFGIEAWKTASLGPGFQNWFYKGNDLATLGANTPPSYLRDPIGFVHLRGRLRPPPPSPTVPPPDIPMIILPEHYRPNKDQMFTVACYMPRSGVTACFADVSKDGWVRIQGNGPADGPNSWIVLDSIIFRAEEISEK